MIPALITIITLSALALYYGCYLAVMYDSKKQAFNPYGLHALLISLLALGCAGFALGDLVELMK